MEEMECLWMVALYPPFAFSTFLVTSLLLFLQMRASEAQILSCISVFFVRFSVCIVFTIGVAWSVYSRQTGFGA